MIFPTQDFILPEQDPVGSSSSTLNSGKKLWAITMPLSEIPPNHSPAVLWQNTITRNVYIAPVRIPEVDKNLVFKIIEKKTDR
jgi:hypothetical protein